MHNPISAVYINCVELVTNADGGRGVDSSRFPGSLGVTYELCAGIIDKPLSPVEIAKEEVIEECGYKVKTENIRRVTGIR